MLSGPTKSQQNISVKIAELTCDFLLGDVRFGPEADGCKNIGQRKDRAPHSCNEDADRAQDEAYTLALSRRRL